MVEGPNCFRRWIPDFAGLKVFAGSVHPMGNLFCLIFWIYC